MKRISLHLLLFILVIIIYLFTHLWEIDKFPIYFFSDEAIQGVRAGQLLKNDFKDEFGNFLSPFFKNFYNYNLGLSVYLNLPGVIMFGKKIGAVRGTTVTTSLLGSIFISLLLKQVIKLKNYWVGLIFLSLIPIFFLHSRTGFETAVATSFYAGFLYFYLLYRTKSRGFLGLAIAFAAFSFYSYAGIWLMILISGIIFMLIDIRYHLKNLRILILGIIFALIIFSPFIRFVQHHKEIINNHLKWYDSYLAKDLTTSEKVKRFIENYKLTFNPNFLFIYDKSYFPRHYLSGYGYFPLWSSPFILLGILWLILQIKKPAARIILFSILISPLGGVLIEPSPTRFLPLVITLAVAFCLGVKTIENVVDRLNKKSISLSFSLILFMFFAYQAIFTAYDAIKNGPLWFRNYGLYGMQYGAKQIFADFIPSYLAKYPDEQIYVSSAWANGSDIYPQFFLKENEREKVQMRNIDYFWYYKQNLTPNILMIMTPDEYKKTKESPKFRVNETYEIIPYPDGNPGFYAVKIAYSQDIDAIFAREEIDRQKLKEAEVIINGQIVKVFYSLLDIEPINNLFDGNTKTLVRGFEANPFVLEMIYDYPTQVNYLSADFGSMADFTVTAKLYQTINNNPLIVSQEYKNLPTDPHITINLDEKLQIRKARIEIKDNHAGKIAKIHVREISLR